MSKKIFEELEMLFVHNKNYRPTVGTDNLNILTRRWNAYKFIKLGIHSVDENRLALELVERLMDISESAHSNSKDDWLLDRLAIQIEKFEKKEYPFNSLQQGGKGTDEIC